ncbi:MAG TPA: SdpI family protein [Clostridia bacterium]|nr:SdpI family protein [Clostridia bacterium]
MKKFNDILKQDWYVLIIILAGFIIGAVFYPRLPERVPIHWDMSGNVNGYGSKMTAAFLLPLINLGVYLLMLVSPKIDPRAKNYEKFKGSYQIIKCIPIAILMIAQISSLLFAVGFKVNIAMVSQIALSLMFIIIGNVMGRFRHNYFVGIRTPWTLANEEVWRKTHRFSGPVWVLGGLADLVLTLAAVRYQTIGFVIILAVMVIVPVVYSYLVFRRINSR